MDGLGEGGCDLHSVSDVGDDGLGDRRELVTNGFAGLGVAVEDRDLRAFFKEASGCGCADSAGASGDQDSLGFQAFHRFSASGLRFEVSGLKVLLVYFASPF